MVLLVRIGKISGAHQAVFADIILTRKVMEHQHPLTEAGCPDLETCPIGGEWICTVLPVPGITRLWSISIMLSIVEYDLKHPVRVFWLIFNREICQKKRAFTGVVKK
jgi:hypothetical protein